MELARQGPLKPQKFLKKLQGFWIHVKIKNILLALHRCTLFKGIYWNFFITFTYKEQ